MTRMLKTLTTLACLAFLLGLGGCFGEEKVEVSYVAFNRTSEPVMFITVNGTGGILYANPMGESSDLCCVVLPKHWRPELRITVGWQADDIPVLDEKGRRVIRDGKSVLRQPPRKSVTVPIREYPPEETGNVFIHFLPGDKVEVVRSRVYPRHPLYEPAHLRIPKEPRSQ
jgi:hypothetical protein